MGLVDEDPSVAAGADDGRQRRDSVHRTKVALHRGAPAYAGRSNSAAATSCGPWHASCI